jgi:hypothetical protein
MSIYEDVLRTGGSVENHGPHLRIEITEANDRILRNYPVQDVLKEICRIPVTGKLCWHIPFAFDPLVARPNAGSPTSNPGLPTSRQGNPFAWNGNSPHDEECWL